MAEVTVSGVSKSFGRDKAVDEVTIHFADGGFYALLGPSGSDKTTLLRMTQLGRHHHAASRSGVEGSARR